MEGKGHPHPLTVLIKEITDYFEPYGFEVVLGPEIETEENNFTKLNIPYNHPARDIQDTFYLNKDNLLLRTHTSPMQIRALETRKPPVRILIPGRVFRNEATDSSHNYIFHHIEGLVIDREVNLRQLIGTLENLLKFIIGRSVEIRTRIGYFPFVEPGIEMDIKLKGQKDWVELLGAGMVHPTVLNNMSIDPIKFNGFAFGIGLERLLVVKCNIADIRTLLNPDYRFLGQFTCK